MPTNTGQPGTFLPPPSRAEESVNHVPGHLSPMYQGFTSAPANIAFERS